MKILKINVLVKTKSKLESVESIDSSHYIIRINTPPEKGKANEKVIELLSLHLKVPKSSIRILSGLKSKKKLLQIEL